MFRICLLVVSFILLAYAKVTFQLSSPIIQSGDAVQLRIIAQSDNVKFPKIDNIGGFAVNQGSSTNFISINGKTKTEITRTFTFYPNQSFIMKSFEVIEDGKSYKSPKYKITVKAPSQTLNQPYKLDIRLNKTEAFINEELELIMRFTIDSGYNLKHLSPQLNMKDFIISPPKEQWLGKRDGFKNIFEKIYYIYPQKDGLIKIEPQKILIGIEDQVSFFGNNIRQYNVFSNKLELQVKPLAKDIDILGNFQLKAFVDKNTVNAGDPINLTVSLEGMGNLEDFAGFELNLPNASIFKDKPDIQSKRTTQGLYTKAIFKYAIVAASAYTIKPFQLTFFDPKLQLKKTIKTEAINIQVKPLATANANQTQQNNNQNPDNKFVENKGIKNQTSTISNYNLWSLPSLLIFGVGFAAGLILLVLIKLIQNFKTKPKQTTSFTKLIKNCKNHEALIRTLLPRVANKDIETFLRKAEDKNDLAKLKKEILLYLKS